MEFFCNPDKYETCEKIKNRPNKTDDDKVPLYWGLLGLLISASGNWAAGRSGRSYAFDSSIRGIGWSIQDWTTNSVWDPIITLWIVRFFIKDNDLINWLFVLFSNISMLGPVLLYWVSTILIIVGYAVDGFEDFGTYGPRLAAWILVTFIASYYQEAWIDEIQDLYKGDNFTFEE